MSQSQADKLRFWLESGGTLRLVQSDDGHALVDLCTCTGELMERCLVDETDALRQLLQQHDLSG